MRRGTLTLAIALGLVALVASAPAQTKHVLRLSSPVAKDHAFGRGAEKFKQLAEEATKGRVEVQVHHANALGPIREGLEMLRLGTLDFQLCGVAHVSRFVAEMNTLVLPYFWKDTPTMFAALDGRMGEVLEGLLLEKGFKLAGWWDNGFRHVSNSKRAVKSPEDIRGLKAGVLGLTRHLAKEYAPHRILVNTLAPGPALVERNFEILTAEAREQLRKEIPLGRWAEPEDLTAAVRFLASAGARHITGATLDVNGGYVMV